MHHRDNLKNSDDNRWRITSSRLRDFLLKMNEPKTPECGYCEIPRSENISRGQQEGGGLEARKKKENIGYCQWYITLTTCVASLSEAISDRLLIK